MQIHCQCVTQRQRHIEALRTDKVVLSDTDECESIHKQICSCEAGLHVHLVASWTLRATADGWKVSEIIRARVCCNDIRACNKSKAAKYLYGGVMCSRSWHNMMTTHVGCAKSFEHRYVLIDPGLRIAGQMQ